MLGACNALRPRRAGEATARWWWLVLACSILVPGALSAQPTSHKRVLVLHSYGPNFAPFSEFVDGLRKELRRQSPAPVEFFEASLETARFPATQTEAPLADYLSVLFDESGFDVVISIGGPAARFCLTHGSRLFPTVPLVIAGLEQRLLGDSLPAHVVSSTVAVDMAGIIENILQLRPETTDILVISTGSALGEFWVQEARRKLQPFTDRVRFAWLYELSLEAMLERVSDLPPGSAIYYGGLIVDGAGVPREDGEALDRLRAKADAPIFGVFDADVGRGLVGGPVVSISEASRRSAAAVLRILNGEAPEAVRTEPVTAGAPVYDFRELERWDIPESRLPPGSTVLFRPASVWDTYKRPLIVGMVIVGLETALIAALLLQSARRRRAEQGARTLSQRLLTAHEDERRRLARDLHDDLSQRLARLTIDVGGMEERLGIVSGETASTSSSDGLARLSEDVHALSYRLHPALIEDLGLCEALQEECERFSDTEGVSARLDYDDLPAELPPEVALCLFRVAQEALRNVARHASASQVIVTLGLVNGGVGLFVTDDGAGFDVQARRSHASLGHESMRERVALVAGRFTIESGSGRGTTVKAWVPCKPTEEATG